MPEALRHSSSQMTNQVPAPASRTCRALGAPVLHHELQDLASPILTRTTNSSLRTYHCTTLLPSLPCSIFDAAPSCCHRRGHEQAKYAKELGTLGFHLVQRNTLPSSYTDLPHARKHTPTCPTLTLLHTIIPPSSLSAVTLHTHLQHCSSSQHHHHLPARPSPSCPP